MWGSGRSPRGGGVLCILGAVGDSWHDGEGASKTGLPTHKETSLYQSCIEGLIRSGLEMMFVLVQTFFFSGKNNNQVAQFLVNRQKAKGNRIPPLNTDTMSNWVHLF